MNEIVMPKLSDTMTEGRLVSWKKRVGDEVRRGEVIAEVETDKANMELEAYVSGVLLEIREQPGALVQVGTVIAVIGKAGEKGGEAAPPPQTAQPQGQGGEALPPDAEGAKQEGQAPQAAAPKAPPEGGGGEAQSPTPPAEAVDLFPLEGEKQAPAAPPVPGSDQTQSASEQAGGKVDAKQYVQTRAPAQGGPAPQFAPTAAAGRERAAPVVRRRARELGIDLGQVQGSGPEGRILLEDLNEAVKGTPQPAAPEPSAPETAAPTTAAQKMAENIPEQGTQGQQPGPRLVQEVKAMSRLRAAVAKTVADSWAHIPHFTVTMEIVMDEAEAVRRQLKQGGMRVTVNDIVIKAVALALQKYPQMNASYTPEGLQFHGEVNVSVAVGVPEGVLMPVVHGCHDRSLLDIAQDADRLVQQARSGALTEGDMNGGTFSVSNLGMFNVDSFSAIIPPSQSGVLAVGSVVDAPVVRAGVLASAKVMKVTLSADHRVVDGAYAAQFLVELKAVLENPVRLLI